MTLKSLAPKSYQSLPPLAPPAGYILVLRDIDADTFRIDSADNPVSAVQSALSESQRKFGIELVSILATQDLAASASELYERHHARLGSDWLELDPYQIEELRRSFLQIDAHESLYLSPDQEFQPAGAALQGPVSRYERLAGAYLQGSREAGEFRRAYTRRHSSYHRYGASSLRRFRERDVEPRRDDLDDPFAQILHLSRRIEEFFQTPRGKVLKFVLTMLLVAFILSLGGSR